MVNKREETVVSGIGEGLQKLALDRYILYVSEQNLRGYFMQNPFHSQNLFAFGKERGAYSGLIFTKNSPISAMFQLEISKLRERGIIEQVRFK